MSHEAEEGLRDPRIPKQFYGPRGFANFLYAAWAAVLPAGTVPTPVQYDIADWMQNGPPDQVTEAFRGVGKSWIASAFVVYSLMMNPQLNIMVVSASRDRADDFSGFCFQLLDAMGILTQHMVPSQDQRTSKVKFDVYDAGVAHAASVFSRGIFSQKTGFRADIIIADDVSTPETSETQGMRDKLERQFREFRSILKPGGGRILVLGTPQTEQDLLHGLPNKGFSVRIWPAEIPHVPLQEQQGDRLAPMIRKMIEDGVPVGTPTDPLRFDEDELQLKRQEGRAYYAMQFLLDHSLADMDRYPLKIPDLMVTDLDPKLCHERYIWANDPELRDQNDTPCVGFNGDYYHRPMAKQGEMVPYTSVVMAVDPSGRGQDETSYAVVAQYAGQLFLLDSGGLQGGYGPEVLQKLVEVARANNVKTMLTEENFGGGMFSTLLNQALQDPETGYRGCGGCEEVHHAHQKEVRICDVLEPLICGHKIIVNRSVVRKDWDSTRKYPAEKREHYMLMHQLSRITRTRAALRHDDRLDALAMACQYWVESMQQNADVIKNRLREKRRDAALRRRVKQGHGRCVHGVLPKKRHGWNPRT